MRWRFSLVHVRVKKLVEEHMNEATILTQAALALIAGLVVAGLVALLNKRRLYVVIPRLFPHQELSSEGQLVEATVLNRGLYMEEDVRIELSPSCTYELIASTGGDITLGGRRITISRLPGNREETVVFLAEGSSFTKEDVANVSSRKAKGTTVDSLDVIPPATKQLGVLAAFTAGLFAFLFFGLPWAETAVKTRKLFQGDRDYRAYVQAEGWQTDEEFFSSGMARYYKDEAFPIRIEPATRTGSDAISITIVVENRTEDPFEASGEVHSPAGTGELGYWDTRFLDLFVMPGKSMPRTMSAYLPESDEVQEVFLEIRLEYQDSYITLERCLKFEQEQESDAANSGVN
jgi:hypothetical protein